MLYALFDKEKINWERLKEKKIVNWKKSNLIKKRMKGKKMILSIVNNFIYFVNIETGNILISILKL